MGHLDSQRSLPVIGDDRTGFSPMAKKLRLANHHSVAILNAPEYMASLKPGPAGIRSDLEPERAYDVVQLFVKDADELRRFVPAAIRARSKLRAYCGSRTRKAALPVGRQTCRRRRGGSSATCWARSHR